MNLLPLQAGDVPDTWADIDDLTRDVGYTPATPVEEGIRAFVDWYLEYYQRRRAGESAGRQPRIGKVLHLSRPREKSLHSGG